MRCQFLKHVCFLFISIVVLFSSRVVYAQLADTPWSTFHANLQRTGRSLYDTSHIDGRVKWSFKTGGGIESSPTIGPDDIIYVGSHDGYLYAIYPDGSLKWKSKVGTPKRKEYGGTVDQTSIASSPTITKEGVIYIASRDQYLFAINSLDGKEIWRFPVSISFDHWPSTAVGKDGTIYIVSSLPRAGVIAINPNGTEKWYYKTRTNSFNSPTIGKDGTIYVALMLTTQSNAVIAFNPDGTIKWKTPTKLQLESTPVVADDGTIYVGSFSQTMKNAGVYALSPDGKIKWHFSDPKTREAFSTPAIGKDGTIYAGMYEGVFYAINPDGTEKWRIELDGTVGTSPAVGADGTIYFGYSPSDKSKDAFYAVNPDGSIKWTALRGHSLSSSPTIGRDGTIYIGSWDRRLYAFGGGDGVQSKNKGSIQTYLIGTAFIIFIFILIVVIRIFKKRTS